MQMSLVSFLVQVAAGSIDVAENHLLIRTGAPARMMLRDLKRLLSSRCGYSYIGIDGNQAPLQAILAHLYTDTIGGKACIWIGSSDGDDVVAPLSHDLLLNLAAYTGPHMLVVEVPATQLLDIYALPWRIIDIPAEHSVAEYRMIRSWVSGTSAQVATPYEQVVYPQLIGAGWDVVYAMAATEVCVGSHARQFCEEWLCEIVVPKPSLFALVGALFAQDRELFYHIWSQVYVRYPDEFWIAFWAEHSWNALAYVGHMQALHTRNSHGSKVSVGKGLPFSFMRADWKRHTLQRLKGLLARVLAYDARMRTGQPIIWEICFEPLF